MSPYTARCFGQTPAPVKAQDAAERASAYYNFSMGHLYAELAAAYGNRGDYVDKAIQHYKAALASDPGASFISEELTDLYIQSGRYRDAVLEAEDMLKRDPGNVDGRRMLGRIYARLIGDAQQNKVNEDMLRRAIDQFEKVVAQDPKDADSWLMLGRLYKISQKTPESEKAYRKVLELDPNNEYALSGLAMVYSDIGDSKNAVAMWRKLAEQNPNPHTLRALANAYEQLHQYSAAAETLKRARALAPKDPDLKRDLAEDLLLSDKPDEALALYNELAAEDAKDPHIQLRLSQIYRQKRDFAKARAAQEKASQLDPNSIEIKYNDVNLLEAEGKTPQAVERLKEILNETAKKTYNPAERSNRAILLERLAVLYRSAEQYPQAVQTFEEIGKIDPDSRARAMALVVDTYRQAKDYAKAEREADAAYKQFPNDRMIRLMRASLLADVGKVDEAAAETRKLLDGKNDRETYLALAQVYEKGKRYQEMGSALDQAQKLSNSPEDMETIHFMRGAMFERMKKGAEAEAEFRKVLEINPKNASALNYLGYMLADRNVRLQEAHKLITDALALDPDNGAYLDSLGWVYFRMGKLDLAESSTRQALEKISTDPTVHDHLGDIYFQQGKVKEAIAQWQASLREWENASRSESDPSEVARVQKKLEGAKVRLARESSGAGRDR